MEKAGTQPRLTGRIPAGTEEPLPISDGSSSGHNVQDTYDKFQESMEAAAEKVVGSTKPKKSPNWVSNTTDLLREEHNQAKLTFHEKPTQENRQKCKELNEQLNRRNSNWQLLEG